MRLEHWQRRILGVIAPFLIIGLALLVNHYIWSLTNSFFSVLAVLILAGFLTGVFFGSDATLYAIAAPSFVLTGISVLQKLFGVRIGPTRDMDAYVYLIITVIWIIMPLGFGARLGQLVASRREIQGFQINWSRLRDWF